MTAAAFQLGATATGAASAAPTDTTLFNVGDVVIGHATKHKQAFDNKKCNVVAMLAKHYKVEMMEGISRGRCHKYDHAAVTPLGPPPTDAPDPETAAAGASATATGVTGAIATPCEAVTGATGVTGAIATATGDTSATGDIATPSADKFTWDDYSFN